MIRIALLCIALATAAPAADPAEDTATADDYGAIMEAAGGAMQRRDFPALVAYLDRAQRLHPWSLNVLKNRILARQLAGRGDEAVALAAGIAEAGLALDLSGHPVLARVAEHPDYAPVAERMTANLEPVGVSRIVLEHDDPGLLPEAIAVEGGTTWIGSVRTGAILEFEAGAEPRRLATLPGGVFDLEVRDDRIWAAVSNALAYRDAEGRPAQSPLAGIFMLDAATGEILERGTLDEEAVLGDLEVGTDGTAWVSDSTTPRILRWRPGMPAPEPFATDPRFVNLQGLALDESRGALFVADYLAGLFRVDLATGEATRLAHPEDAFLGGIDGRRLAGERQLIGIQNGTTPRRIVCLELDDEATAAESLQVAARALPEWNEPTHGDLVDGRLVYIATSNWPSYDEDFEESDESTLEPLRIMRLDSKEACKV
ncbi:MAG: hypothetical protein R3323_03045 [Wenzhouxiangellaceae bacterium]|nr:hypothetical protein [Wenzhouxiangellaceae bacterium]